jgi:hypothetical protein
MSTPLTSAIRISDISIRQDSSGRYSLNDLHKSSGGEQRHQPRYWLENQQTQELIAELGKESDSGIPASKQIQPVSTIISTIKGGRGLQGTFVVKELVYGYAMWISPAFNLKVIRTFDAVMTVASTPINPTPPRPDSLTPPRNSGSR